MMKDVLFIEGRRTGYGVDQIEDMTMTLNELIENLQNIRYNYGGDMVVVLNNDNGYTFGEICESSFEVSEYDNNEENDDEEEE